MKIDKQGSLVVTKQSVFPSLIDEGRKYGLNEQQISILQRYLNDKRMLRLINLESFNRNARAWLSALTGIVAEVLAMDAHATIWLNKKLEKPRNWILSKLNEVIPTKIDDIAIQAINVAQQFMDEKLLPAKEKIASELSSKMHNKYEYHNNATHLGQTPKELKAVAKNILRESKDAAQDTIKLLKNRQLQATMYNGLYKDENGYWVNTSPYQSRENAQYLKTVNERTRRKNERKEQISQNKQNNEINEQGEIP